MDVKIPELEILLIDREFESGKDQISYRPEDRQFVIVTPSEGPLVVVKQDDGSELRVVPTAVKLRLSREWFDRLAGLLRGADSQ